MEPQIAFCVVEHAPPGLVIRVNFGIVAGREATAAEIDELARLLSPDVANVSIVSETRHEIGPGVEAAVHQVRIEVDGASVAGGREELCERIVERADFWARMCAAERHTDV